MSGVRIACFAVFISNAAFGALAAGARNRSRCAEPKLPRLVLAVARAGTSGVFNGRIRLVCHRMPCARRSPVVRPRIDF